jgi:hypothetical protein
MFPHAQQTSPLQSVSETALSPLKALLICIYMSRTFIYLGTPIESFEHMRIPIKLTPQEIIAEYNLLSLVSDGHVYIEVQKGMHGLPQTGILANQLLSRRLVVH